MDFKQRIANGLRGLISLPSFKITGTSMDIKQLYGQLQENDQHLRGKNSNRLKTRNLQTQWKTRIG